MTNKLNENKMNIQCEWMDTQRVLINPDGQVLPCCYLANVVYMYDKMNGEGAQYVLDKDESVEKRLARRKKFKEKISGKKSNINYYVNDQTRQDNVLMDYYENKEKYNIFENSLEDIINSDWFTKTLPESWDDPNLTIRQCAKHCTKKNYDESV